MNDLPLGDGAGAMKVNRLGAAGAPETGRQVHCNTFATDITITRGNIAGPAECARTRRAVENSLFREPRKFRHPGHDFGHGSRTLSSVPAMSDLIALLVQGACRMVCGRWQAARRRRVARCRMPDRMKIPAGHVVPADRDRCLGTITTGEPPEQPP